MSLKSFSCYVRCSFMLLGLLGALTCTQDVFADKAIPGTTYKFYADYYGITAKPTKHLSELEKIAESWAPGEGPKHAGCNIGGDPCLCSTYIGAPSCDANTSTHYIPCFANYAVTDSCGSTVKQYTSRVNYITYGYVHYMTVELDLNKNEENLEYVEHL